MATAKRTSNTAEKKTTARKTTAKAPAKQGATRKRATAQSTAPSEEESKPQKADLPKDWQKQAKEIIKMAESSGMQENFFFKTTFERYLTQIKILADLQQTINSTDTLITKQYVKGRGNLYANPAIREYTHVTDSANKTVQTLIKILNGFKSSDSGNEKDQLLAIINGGEDDE